MDSAAATQLRTDSNKDPFYLSMFIYDHSFLNPRWIKPKAPAAQY